MPAALNYEIYPTLKTLEPVNASTSHLTSWLAFSNVKQMPLMRVGLLWKSNFDLSLISTTEPQTAKEPESPGPVGGWRFIMRH